MTSSIRRSLASIGVSCKLKNLAKIENIEIQTVLRTRGAGVSTWHVLLDCEHYSGFLFHRVALKLTPQLVTCSFFLLFAVLRHISPAVCFHILSIPRSDTAGTYFLHSSAYFYSKSMLRIFLIHLPPSVLTKLPTANAATRNRWLCAPDSLRPSVAAGVLLHAKNAARDPEYGRFC